jgi:hypothetical protein
MFVIAEPYTADQLYTAIDNLLRKRARCLRDLCVIWKSYQITL